jgi:hypothetical protein
MDLPALSNVVRRKHGWTYQLFRMLLGENTDGQENGRRSDSQNSDPIKLTFLFLRKEGYEQRQNNGTLQ